MAADRVKEIKSKYGIVGRDKELSLILKALESGKNVLLEGSVGIGKTRLAIAVTSYLGRPAFRVDGDERYTETKLTGWFDPPIVLSKGYGWDSFIAGPLAQAMMEGGVIFINELNRMPETTQNVLLPVMDEGRLIIPRLGEIRAKEGFAVIATQNPQEFVGTSRISEALRDRFVWIGLKHQSFDEEVEIVSREAGGAPLPLVRMAVSITRRTRDHKELRRGASVRGAIDIVALMKGNPDVSAKSLIDASVLALYNRVDVNLKSARTKEDIISEIVRSLLREAQEGGGSPGSGDPQGSPAVRQPAKQQPPSDNPEMTAKEDEALKYLLKYGGIRAADFTLGRSEPTDRRWAIINDYLDEGLTKEQKRLMEDEVCRAISSLAAEISEKGAKRYFRRVEYSREPVLNEDFDLESTLENALGKSTMDYGDIGYVRKIPKKSATALMLDISFSMGGNKLIMAALAIAALAYKLEDEYYSIVSFRETAELVKGIDERLPSEEVISRILNLNCGGLTNIEDGLKKGNEQIDLCASREDLAETMGIIVTDGCASEGGDPIVPARNYQKLHVVQVDMGVSASSNEKVCEGIASAGHGTHTFVGEFNSLPYAIMNILRS